MQGVFGGLLCRGWSLRIPNPLSFSIIPMSGVPVPDGTGTLYMCPREFQLFPSFQRFPQYYSFRNNISDFRNYIFGFRNNKSGFRDIRNVSRCSSTRQVQYHSIWGTTPSHIHSCQLSRSCEFEGASTTFEGVLCRARSL
jgi:hypothetical protein